MLTWICLNQAGRARVSIRAETGDGLVVRRDLTRTSVTTWSRHTQTRILNRKIMTDGKNIEYDLNVKSMGKC